MTGRIWSFRLREGKADDVVEHTRNFEDVFPHGGDLTISTFGRDNDGELYIVDHKTGRVIKIVP